ncbi:putative quinol monooxygenase [Naasia lichenicola]|uniref:ABM domain-containing protein n=1 Tax=Naasia lichenicola TaxID=2565933 RepID=A0A4S4FQ82_9MICO|nr:antibiotic biosynthesis monooxygenase family protein [Naasia lichenicola]THG31526.1 hypothetical protein E6C64_05465 [Naasia lichenicola]
MAITALLDLRLRAESVETAAGVLDRILRVTRNRPGSLGVEVLNDITDPTHLTLVERWESIADDDAYRAWRATPEGSSGLAEILSEPPRLWRCDTSATF